jgi:tRNA-dihydrouridine synthase
MDLRFTEEERPIVAQLFSADPEKMEQAAKLVQEMGFDGLDINMGCPDKTIEKQGAGAAHIKNPQLAKEVIRAAKRGAPNLPVSVRLALGTTRMR